MRGAGDEVTLWTLSLQEPFASLVLDGVKTIDSQSSDHLAAMEGRWVAVRMGGKQWQASERGAPTKGGRKIAARPGLEAWHARVAGVMRLGRTVPKAEALSAMGRRAFEDACCLRFEQAGRFVTEVLEVCWLRAPLAATRQPLVLSYTPTGAVAARDQKPGQRRLASGSQQQPLAW